MRAILDEQNVIKANDQFWEQMLAMKLETISDSEHLSACSKHMRGSVGIKGAWEGCIEVRMECGLAYEAAAAMMMQPVETVAELDVADALKEIANMIGGILKSALPRPTSMNVPEFAMEAEGFSIPYGAREGCLAVAFQHVSGAMMVRVVELTEDL
jgi:chemotaxis protein CheX